MTEDVTRIKDPLGVTHTIRRRRPTRESELDEVPPWERDTLGNGTAPANGNRKNGSFPTHVTTTLDPWSQIAIMLISALSFISAFAWNGMMSAFLNQKFGKDRDFKVHLIYAISVTVVAAISIYFIVKYTDVWISEQQEEEDIVGL